jgi:hypothetical protein
MARIDGPPPLRRTAVARQHWGAKEAAAQTRRAAVNFRSGRDRRSPDLNPERRAKCW